MEPTFLSFSNVVLSPPKLGIEDFDGGRYEDGFLSCSFKRPTVVEVAKYGQTFNLEKDKYIIFLAEGAFRGGQMFKHRRKTKSAELQVHSIFFYIRYIVIFCLGTVPYIPLVKCP